jgi:hypothetical protein
MVECRPLEYNPQIATAILVSSFPVALLFRWHVSEMICVQVETVRGRVRRIPLRFWRGLTTFIIASIMLQLSWRSTALYSALLVNTSCDHSRRDIAPMVGHTDSAKSASSTAQVLPPSAPGLTPSMWVALSDLLDEMKKPQARSPQDLEHANNALAMLGSVQRCPREQRPYIENPANIAICMYGSFRVSNLTVSSFRRFVYEHLGHPDLFLYLVPYHLPGVAHWQGEMKAMAKRLWSEPDVDYKAIHARGGYSSCLDRPDCRFNAGWPTSSYKGSELHQMRGAGKCGVMIKEAEKERGRSYDRIIFTRTDHVYVGPHPLMESLASGVTWIPTGEDYIGLKFI